MNNNTENAFIVRGGTPLKGEVVVSGAKNVGLKIIIAALMYDEKLTIKNIPNLKDIRELLKLASSIGVGVDFENNTLELDPSNLKKHTVDLLFGSKIRTSFMLFAPFIHRFGKALIPNPGGCRIGARPIDRQISLMDAFGISTQYDSSTGYYNAQLAGEKVKGADFTFDKKTHTGTELAIMFAVLAEGESIIRNAALEPEIDNLIDFLNISGAKIKRSGHEIHIQGVEELSAPKSFPILPDRNEAQTYAVFAYATKGDVLVKNVDKDHLAEFLKELDGIGAKYEINENSIRFYHSGDLSSSHITTEPEPGFMTDWQAPWAVLMTQVTGDSTIHETVFDNRFGYVSELKKLGAHIEFYKPEVDNPKETYQFDASQHDFDSAMQGIKIHGPTSLHGGVMHVTDMRAGATLLVGACVAEGESVVIGASEIDRGYENIESKLTALGADIKRV